MPRYGKGWAPSRRVTWCEDETYIVEGSELVYTDVLSAMDAAKVSGAQVYRRSDGKPIRAFAPIRESKGDGHDH